MNYGNENNTVTWAAAGSKQPYPKYSVEARQSGRASAPYHRIRPDTPVSE